MFNLKAGNHEVIADQRAVHDEGGVHRGDRVRPQECAVDANFSRKLAKDGSNYFVLGAANHQTIGTSEMYSSASAMEKGIASVKANAPAATFKDFFC